MNVRVTDSSRRRRRRDRNIKKEEVEERAGFLFFFLKMLERAKQQAYTQLCLHYYNNGKLRRRNVFFCSASNENKSNPTYYPRNLETIKKHETLSVEKMYTHIALLSSRTHPSHLSIRPSSLTFHNIITSWHLFFFFYVSFLLNRCAEKCSDGLREKRMQHDRGLKKRRNYF